MIWKLARKELAKVLTSSWSPQNSFLFPFPYFLQWKLAPNIMSPLTLFCSFFKNFCYVCFSLFNVISSIFLVCSLFSTLTPWLSSGGVGREEGGSERKRWGWGSGVHYRWAAGSWWVGCWRRAVHGLRRPWPGKQGGLLSRPGSRLPIMD